MSSVGDRPEPAAAMRARIAELEEENARLAASASATAGSTAAAADAPRRGAWLRSLASALCLALAAVLIPVSIVTAWTRAELVETERFVATFGPLIEDEHVQELIIDQVTGVIDNSLDIAAITDDLFDGIASLDLPPRALAAVDLLRVPAAQGLRGLITETTTRIVTSDLFADAWTNTLRASHRGLVVAATGGESGLVTIDEAGVVGIELGAIVAEVRTRLIDQGVSFAVAIPDVDRTIVILQSDALVTVRVAYSAAVMVGWWLPVVALALLVAGVLLARRRATALMGAGIAVALGAGTLAVGFAVGNTISTLVASELTLPALAVTAIYEQVIGDMRQTAIVLTAIGVVVAALAWTQSRRAGAVAMRRAVGGVNEGLRTMLARRGASTGRFGVWVDRQRFLVRTLIAVGAVVWLWFARPLTIGDIVLVLVVALLVWWAAELVRPAPVSSADASFVPDDDAVVASSSSTA